MQRLQTFTRRGEPLTFGFNIGVTDLITSNSAFTANHANFSHYSTLPAYLIVTRNIVAQCALANKIFLISLFIKRVLFTFIENYVAWHLRSKGGSK